jgi:hypothetical protein
MKALPLLFFYLFSFTFYACNTENKDFCYFVNRFYEDYHIPSESSVLLLTNPKCKKTSESTLCERYKDISYIIYDKDVYLFNGKYCPNLIPLDYLTILKYKLLVLNESKLELNKNSCTLVDLSLE